MGNWQEFEIKDFRGIATANRNPQKNECHECKNMDLRENTGDLVVRGGYSLKYAPPDDSRDKIASAFSLAFENFYVPDVGGGQEVTCLVQRGTINGETGVLYSAPASINAILIWIRKWWDGSTWQDSWQWLNQTVLTKVSAVDGYKIKLDMADTSVITSNLFQGWTIYNVTKGYAAKVIKTYDYGSTTVGVKITRERHDWAATDTVILMKNYIPYEYLTGNYSATFNEVCFHKVLNDLRIGFGGQSGRLSFSIGYRKRYWKLNDYSFGSGDADLSLTAFDMDGIILDPYIPIDNKGLISFNVSVGTLAAGTYYFKVISCLDDYEHVQIGENSLVTESTVDLLLTPKVDFASLNRRTTYISLYWADNNEVYHWLQDFNLLGETTDDKTFSIDLYGRVTFKEESTVNLYTQDTALKVGSDSDNANGWTVDVGDVVISSVTTAPVPKDGTYCIKFAAAYHPFQFDRRVNMSLSFLSPGKYIFNFWLQTDHANQTLCGIGKAQQDLNDAYLIDLAPADGWMEITKEFEITDPNTQCFVLVYRNTEPESHFLAIDKLIISQGEYNPSLSGSTKTGTELTADLGYDTKGIEYAKSWDQAVVTQGKTFVINPYIDKRYQNKIFFSPISGAGAFQYDVLSNYYANYYDLENFDGNDMIGLSVLPNLNFLALKRNSAQQVDAQSGESTYTKFSAGIISRKSAVNFGDRIMYCNENDIINTNAIDYDDLSEGYIRDQYRTLTTKGNIIAGREEKDNSYRFFTGDTTNKTEFIFTPRGWIKQVQAIYPAAYALSKDGSLWFMRNGAIYDRTTGNADVGTAIPFNWKSVPIDISLAGENVTGNMRWYIDAVWVYFTQLSNIVLTIKLYFDNKTTEFQSLTTPYTTAGTRRFQKRLRLGAKGRSFQIEVSGSDNIGGQVIIHSLGIMYKLIPVGMYGNN
jgi:hypothetical protein